MCPKRLGSLSPVAAAFVCTGLVKTSEMIDKAGGKVLGGNVKEGEFGLYLFFEDTEGSMGAIYQMVQK